MNKPLILIAYKDPQVNLIQWSRWWGLCTDEQCEQAMSTLAKGRIDTLVDNGMNEDQAMNEVLDEMYALDGEETHKNLDIVIF